MDYDFTSPSEKNDSKTLHTCIISHFVDCVHLCIRHRVGEIFLKISSASVSTEVYSSI